jgi:hypothetical protein
MRKAKTLSNGLLRNSPSERESDDELLTTSPTARELDVSPQAVILWEKLGILPAIKTASGQRLFRRGDVRRLKAERLARKRA